MTLATVIREKIAEKNAISVAEFMALALGHPEHGYYMYKDPLGARGDFTTAPEISQIFGEMIGAWMAQQWRIMGEPPATLMELGPGRGTLMADFLRITRHVEQFHDSVEVRMVETSPALTAKQQETLAYVHPRISWHKSIELPPKPLLLVANEFFDALPIRQFVSQGKEIRERMVALDADNNLTFNPEDGRVIREHCPAAISIMGQLATHIATYGGVAIIVDYGYIGGSRADTLQALKNHAYHNPLEDVGEADITAHVDFNALKDAAKAAGANVHGAVSQGMFLDRLGATIRAGMLCKKASDEQKQTIMAGLSRLIAPEQMGDLFKVIAVCGPRHPKPEGF